MKLFTRVPLTVKLFLTSILPMLGIVYLSYLFYQYKSNKISNAQEFIEQLKVYATISDLSDNLRQERRVSLNNVIQNDSRINLLNERDIVDKSVEKVKELVEPIRLNISNEVSYFSQLPELREKIDNNLLDIEEVVDRYQLLLDRLQSYSQTTNLSIPPEFVDSLKINSIFNYLINYYSLMRLQVYAKYQDNISYHERFASRFQQNYRFYRSYEQELFDSQSPSLINKYKELTSEKNLNLSLNYFKDHYKNPELKDTLAMQSWWQISGDGMDALILAKHQLIQATQHQADILFIKEIKERRFSIVLLITAFLFFILFNYLILKTLKVELYELTSAAKKMAQGITDIHLPIFPRDEMGSLARSFIQIDRNNKKVASAAAQIGKHIFDTPFKLRGDKDELGSSILKMQDSLQKLLISNENEIWIQTGLSTINQVLIGQKSLEEACKSALSAMVSYLDGDIGTLYLLTHTEYLELKSTHATVQLSKIPKMIALGESRLGEAALHRKPLFLNNIPEDYLSISSSTGKSQPAHLLILPLLQDGELEGVMEIASFTPFHPNLERFLDYVSVNIATSIHAIRSRMRLQELLEESKTQSEELQLKHTELENLNTELEAQAQKLQASEEELKVQQEELIQSNQELEERSNLLEERNQIIIERNLEIQRKAEELELSNRYKSEFLANMSHELRTPLNSILLLSRLLSENSDKRLSLEQVEFAEVIQTSGINLLTLIDEILDLSKIEAGKMEMEFQQETVQDIISSMRSMFGTMAKEKMLEMSFHIADDAPEKIFTDRLRLEQVLKNLLSNALKFTKQGFISVKVESDPQHKDQLLFKVKDSGIGIPIDKRQHIFGAFQQADGSTRRKYGGTGLGLSISRELAKLLGGTLTINESILEGSEFILRIPNDASDPIKIVAEKEIEIPSPIAPIIDVKTQEERFLSFIIPDEIPDDRENIQEGDKVILIIEDDTIFAKALMTFSNKKGYKCILSVRGDRGIELANQFQPQGILLDLQLPIKDGWQVMAELKENPATRHIPVHMMSSYAIKHESLKKGAIDFISKPVAFEQMNSIFNKLENVFQKGSKKVLIVEENIQHAKALAYYLESFDIKVEIKKDIDDSIDALSNNKIDCVILDMGIPDPITYQTLETVKEKPGLENLPIIIFTGNNLSKVEEQKINQYANTILIKTAHSYERILNEVALFLHLVEQNKEEMHPKLKPSLLHFNETLHGKTVILADDDVRNIFSLTKTLENHGMIVLPASNGKEAIHLLEENGDLVDVILMDMMMPEMDGYETTSRIRSTPKFSDIPILAVTAKAMMVDREKCIEAGASDYISKPVDPDQLISLLRVWLYK